MLKFRASALLGTRGCLQVAGSHSTECRRGVPAGTVDRGHWWQPWSSQPASLQVTEDAGPVLQSVGGWLLMKGSCVTVVQSISLSVGFSQ